MLYLFKSVFKSNHPVFLNLSFYPQNSEDKWKWETKVAWTGSVGGRGWPLRHSWQGGGCHAAKVMYLIGPRSQLSRPPRPLGSPFWMLPVRNVFHFHHWLLETARMTGRLFEQFHYPSREKVEWLLMLFIMSRIENLIFKPKVLKAWGLLNSCLVWLTGLQPKFEEM